MAFERTTTDHQQILDWARRHNALPAELSIVPHDSEPAILAFVVPGQPQKELRKISWEHFFAVFDLHGLALIFHEDSASGGASDFYAIVNNAPKSGAMELGAN